MGSPQAPRPSHGPNKPCLSIVHEEGTPKTPPAAGPPSRYVDRSAMKTRTKRTTSPVLNILGRQGTSPSIVRACLPACQPVALVRVCVPASQSARRAWVYVCLPVSQPFGIGFLCVCMRASQPVALGCVCVYPYAPASQPVALGCMCVCMSVPVCICLPANPSCFAAFIFSTYAYHTRRAIASFTEWISTAYHYTRRSKSKRRGLCKF